MSAVVEARNITHAYGRHVVLDDVSLALHAGEITAIMGPSGSGKTTLLRILHLLEAPQRGTVLFDGAPAKDRIATMRRIGLVQQKPGLLRLRAWENVAFPLRARGVQKVAAKERALAQLARLGLTSHANAWPHELSGGEVQRVGIARALVSAPEVLLLDEATNQLDERTEAAVEALVRDARAAGAAIALVTHSPAQARRLADRTMALPVHPSN